MAGMFALNSILGMIIILALVITTGKQNSVPGHARSADPAGGFPRRSPARAAGARSKMF